MEIDMEDITEPVADEQTFFTNNASVGTSRDHQLWVNLSAFGDGNVFGVLPELLKKMLLDESTDMADDFVDVILPSDDAWQTKIYYKLVEKQRLTDSTTPTEMMLESSLYDFDRENKLHDWIIRKSKSPVCEIEPYSPQKRPKETRRLAPITWTVSDISKAGGLLTIPPQNVTFEDEQEMRRVYTLIYDVFRYKQVLMEALNDILFFQMFPNLKESVAHVWLLLYDLYHRSFRKRETAVAPIAAKLFDTVGITFAETALWTQRIKLAAAVARLRDSNWLIREIEKTFGLRMVDDVDRLEKETFKWDRHCPQIICFHASMRTRLARSSLIKNHMLIVQDKSFCLGAATFDKVVSDLELTGCVIQTHVNSPRTTAYLATLLTHNEKIKKLLAFSAGTRKREYESYFSELGMKNVRIFADRLIDLPPDANYMEEVVAIFATPPNSYSAVTDPIDLVCSRGGDLSMLEALTESEETTEGKERVANILNEQKKTLRFAMSRPQIQLVLYETHSELEAENDGMVNKTLKDVNKLAKLQHASLQGKIPFQCQVAEDQIMVDIKEVNNNEKLQKMEDELGENNKSAAEQPISSVIADEDIFLDSIEVPNTDIFYIPALPTLCPSEKTCDSFKNEGCYLALIQRKEVIRLDDKYMIQMAENRGLFGSTSNAALSKSKTSRAGKKKEKVDRRPRSRKKLKDLEIDRIAAPTHTFLCHSNHQDVQMCKKCEPQEESYTVSQYRRWWAEATRHILSLKRTLSRHKILPTPMFKPPPQNEEQRQKNVVDTFIGQSLKIDEIAAKANVQSKFPIFPKLRLTRNQNIVRVQIPLTVTNVEFPRGYCPFHMI